MTGQLAHPQESTLRVRICHVLSIASLILANLACSGAGFERAPNAKKHRALPLGSTVYVAANASDLVQPVEYIGLMRATTKGDPANRAEAEETLRLPQRVTAVMRLRKFNHRGVRSKPHVVTGP